MAASQVNLLDVFEELLALQSDARRQRVEELNLSQDERRKVESWVRQHDTRDETPDFLDSPPPLIADAMSLLRDVAPIPSASGDSHTYSVIDAAGQSFTHHTDPHSQPRVHGYEILSRLGEGGTATVWRARQLSTRREIALKILSNPSGSLRQQMRFEREVELAAKLEHPFIARVYDSGSSDGRLYYAMELVEGLPLDQYATRNNLSPKQILALMRDICLAVQHAHQHGVIHRDLKPSNILITPDSHPRILDFGLAKALDETDPDLTLTRDGQIAGTPAFMSPQQAAGLVDKLDTRTDVYSLGATLYLLLTGHSAHELTGTRHEVLHRVANDDVRRPRLMNSRLDIELESLLLKALDHEPDRRYPSARDLALDIESYLRGEALVAAPPSRTYRLRKLLRKHRVPIGIAAAFVLVLMTASFISSWQAVRANRASRREEALRKQSDTVSRTLESVFRRIDPERAGGDLRSSMLIEINNLAAAANPNPDPDAPDDPLARARLRSALGSTEVGLGETAKGELLLRAAYQEQLRLLGPDDPDTLMTMSTLAHAWDVAGRYQEAISLFEEAKVRQIKVLGADHHDTWVTISDLGMAYEHCGRYADAVTVFEKVLAHKKQQIPLDDRDILVGMNNVGTAYIAAGRFRDAIDIFEKARDAEVNFFGPTHIATLTTLANLAFAYDRAGRSVEAIKLYEQVRDPTAQQLGTNHRQVLTLLSNMATAYQSVGRRPEAITVLEQVRNQRKKELGPDHPDTLLATVALGGAYYEGGRVPESLPLLEEARGKLEQRFGVKHPFTLIATSNLGAAYARNKNFAKAIPLLESAKEGEAQSLGADHPDTLTTLDELAAAYYHAGRTDDGLALGEQVLQRRTKTLGPQHPRTLETTKGLAEAGMAQGIYDKAAPLWLELCNWTAAHPQGLPSLGITSDRIFPKLIACYQSLGDLEHAEEWKMKLATLEQAKQPEKP